MIIKTFSTKKVFQSMNSIYKKSTLLSKDKTLNFGNLNSCSEVISKISKLNKFKYMPFENKFKFFGWYLYVLNRKDKSHIPMLSSEEEEIIQEIKEYFDISKYNEVDYEEYEEKVNKLEKDVVIKFINNGSSVKNDALFIEIKTSLLRMVLFYNFTFSSKLIGSSGLKEEDKSESSIFKYLIIGIGNLYYRINKLSSIEELIVLDSLDKKLQEILISVSAESNNHKNQFDFESILTILHVVSKVNNHMNGVYSYFLSVIYEKLKEEEEKDGVSLKNKLILLYITIKLGFSHGVLKGITSLVDSIDVSINENPYESLNLLKDMNNDYIFNNLVISLVGLYGISKDFHEKIVSISKIIMKISKENENFLEKMKSNQAFMLLMLISIVNNQLNYSNNEFINDLFRKLDACEYKIKPCLLKYKYILNPCFGMEEDQSKTESSIVKIEKILSLVYKKSSQIEYFQSLNLDFYSKYLYVFNLLLHKSEFDYAFSLLNSEINITFYYLLIKDTSLVIEYLIIIEYLLSIHDFHIIKNMFKPFLNLVSEKQISFETHPNSFFLYDFMVNSNMISIEDYSKEAFQITSNEIFSIWFNNLPPKLKCIVIHSKINEKTNEKQRKNALFIKNKSIYMNKFDRLSCKRQYNLKLIDLKLKKSKENPQFDQILPNKKGLFDVFFPFQKVGFILYDTNNYFKFRNWRIERKDNISYMSIIYKNYILYCKEEYSIKLEIFSSQVLN